MSALGGEAAAAWTVRLRKAAAGSMRRMSLAPSAHLRGVELQHHLPIAGGRTEASARTSAAGTLHQLWARGAFAIAEEHPVAW
jgi:hypothetical protein